eukprot:3874811-Prymnesium_polylepis.1
MPTEIREFSSRRREEPNAEDARLPRITRPSARSAEPCTHATSCRASRPIRPPRCQTWPARHADTRSHLVEPAFRRD